MTFRNLLTLARGPRETLLTGLSSLVLRIVGLLCTFGLGVVLARALGPAGFGIYGLVVSVAALGMTLSLLGTPQLAVREISVRSAQGDWGGVKLLIRRFGLVSSTAALLLGAAALAISFAASMNGATIPLLVFLGALLTLATTITALIAAELRALGAMLKGQFMEIAGRPAAALVIYLTIVAVGIPISPTGALWVQVSVAVVAAAVSVIWIRGALPIEQKSIRASGDIDWVAAAVPLWLVDVLRQVDGTYGVILMGWFASPAELGIYRVAFSCMAVVAMPVSVLHIIQAPIISKLYKFGDQEALQQILSTTSAWMVLMVTPITLGAWLIGRPAISQVFGVDYVDAWLPLFILCLSQLVFCIFGMGPIMLAMCDGERHLIKIYIISVGVATAAAVPLVIAYGANGAAAAIVISNGLVGFLSWSYGKSRLGVDSTFLPLLRPAHGK
jgi:O-antigen/teichoic acid export membrane protein